MGVANCDPHIETTGRNQPTNKFGRSRLNFTTVALQHVKSRLPTQFRTVPIPCDEADDVVLVKNRGADDAHDAVLLEEMTKAGRTARKHTAGEEPNGPIEAHGKRQAPLVQIACQVRLVATILRSERQFVQLHYAG